VAADYERPGAFILQPMGRVVMQPFSGGDRLPCRAQPVANRVGGCPDDRCPLWQPGGTIFEGRCVYDELDVPDRQTFESWLLRLRRELARARSDEERNELRRLFYRLLETRGRSGSIERESGLDDDEDRDSYQHCREEGRESALIEPAAEPTAE
jgi:hypothetical protein